MLKKTLQGHTKAVNSVIYLDDKDQIVSCSDDKTLKRWSATTGECLQTLQGHTFHVYSVIYLHDKDQIVSCSVDNTLKRWSATTGECLQTLKGHTHSVLSVIYLHDKDQIVSCSPDNTLKIWSATTGECLQTLQGHTDCVLSVIYLHDKDQIVSCSRDGTLKRWSATTGECLQTLQGHTFYVNSVIYLHDKDQIVSCSADKTLKIWSATTGECLQTLQGHTSYVNSVIYLHDKDQIVSCSDDKTLKIWSLEGIGQKKPKPILPPQQQPTPPPPSSPPVVVLPPKPEPQPKPQQRTSGYFNLFHNELKFSEQDTNTYTTLLKERGWDTKDDFVEGLQDGDIDLNSFKDGKDKSVFKEGHQKKLLKKFNITPSSSPTSQSTLSNQLHPNDILLENGMYFLDCSVNTSTSTIKNIVPLYSNNLQRQRFILKLHNDIHSQQKECEILQVLQHPTLIVRLIDKLTTTKIPSISSLTYGLVLEQGKWDLSKKLHHPSWMKVSDIQKLDYIQQMLEVVRFVNEKGYVWRDVKPTNFVFFGDDDNLDGGLRGIDFDISLPKGTEIQDTQSTSLYIPPEIAKLYISNFSTKMYINETYDSWSMGMVIFEMINNQHYIPMERMNNHPHHSASESHDHILRRVGEDSFLEDIKTYIESHYQHKSFSYPILSSLLCESSKRKSVKEILQMDCFRIDRTSKTKMFRDGLNSIGHQLDKLDDKVTQGFQKLQVDFDQMKVSIIEELNDTNIKQYMDLKNVLYEIQSSIPNERTELEIFISDELSRVMSCVSNESCKTELATLQKTLLLQLQSQQISLDEITSELQMGFTTLQDSLEEVHTKLDSVSQTIITFQVEMMSQLSSIKKGDIDEDDVDCVLGDLETTNNQIETLQSKTKLRNKDVMNIIDKSIPMMKTNFQNTLELSNLQGFQELQTQLEQKCKESQENQEQLHSLLSTFSIFMKQVKERVETIKNE